MWRSQGDVQTAGTSGFDCCVSQLPELVSMTNFVAEQANVAEE